MPDLSLENQLRAAGYHAVCGVDEAGRGPLCGPVVAAACILPPDIDLPGLNDSKKLTSRKRDILFDLIRECAVAWCVAEGSVEEINRLNILEADLLAMRRAIAGLHTPDGTPVAADYALIDGNIARDFQLPARAVIKGDALSLSVAAGLGARQGHAGPPVHGAGSAVPAVRHRQTQGLRNRRAHGGTAAVRSGTHLPGEVCPVFCGRMYPRKKKNHE